MKIDCNGTAGRIIAFGKLWGDEAIDSLISFHKKNPKTMIFFRGFTSQYLNQGKDRYMNFSFTSWSICVGQDPRAAFIIIGRITGIENKNGYGVLLIDVDKKGRNGYGDSTETFHIWSLSFDALQTFKPGETWKVKGLIQQGRGMDHFGDTDGLIRPFIMDAERAD